MDAPYVLSRLDSSGIGNKPVPELPESLESAVRKEQVALACLPMPPSAAYESAPQAHQEPDKPAMPQGWYGKMGDMMRQPE